MIFFAIDQLTKEGLYNIGQVAGEKEKSEFAFKIDNFA